MWWILQRRHDIFLYSRTRDQQDHTLHFHAYYQDNVAVYGIEPVDLISGGLPRRQQCMVEAWAEMHQAELQTDWERLQTGQEPLPVQPLS